MKFLLTPFMASRAPWRVCNEFFHFRMSTSIFKQPLKIAKKANFKGPLKGTLGHEHFFDPIYGIKRPSGGFEMNFSILG